MTKPKVTITKIKFKSGDAIEFGENEVVVIVGPNNVGKTLLLSEIFTKLSVPTAKTKIIENIEFTKEGTEEDLLSYLSEISIIDDEKYPQNPTFLTGKVNLQKNEIVTQWSHVDQLNSLAHLFINQLTTQARLNTNATAEAVALATEPPQRPAHHLYENEVLENQISSLLKNAFGKDLIVVRGGGKIIYLRIGDKELLLEGEKDFHRSFRERQLEKSEEIDAQGDGIKSFATILLEILTSDSSIFLIDEPEAFLHPPQAKLMGEFLANSSNSGSQFFLATHSGDFLRGINNSNTEKKIRVIRVDRTGTNNVFKELKPEEIRLLWDDPLLRYSKVLDGIFHKQVIVCESESDCRLYEAIMDAILPDLNLENPPDILFTSGGGVARIKKIVTPLKALNVPTFAIADFDVLREESSIEGIVTSQGGDWAFLKDGWQTIKAHIDSLEAQLSVADLKQKIIDELPEPESLVDGPLVENLREVIKVPNPWVSAKKLGKGIIEDAENKALLESLLASFKNLGIFIVEKGEPESYCSEIGGHGSAYVSKVLEDKNLKTDTELEGLRSLIKDLLLSF